MAAPKRKPASKEPKPAGARILVVEARFYNDIADALLAGCAKALDDAKAAWDIITVPGSLEIVPAIAIAVDAAEKQKKPYDGVVALDGVSLTVNEVAADTFSVLIIPHTLSVTTLGTTKTGDTMNLEIDLMARYAARLMETK